MSELPEYSNIDLPGPPYSGLTFFTKPQRPRWIHSLSAAGQEAILRPETFGANAFSYYPAANTAQGYSKGLVFEQTPAASVTYPVPTSGSYPDTFTRTQLVSGTSVFTTAGLFTRAFPSTSPRVPEPDFWRGNSAGLGGFLVRSRWCRRTSQNGTRGGFFLGSEYSLSNFEPSGVVNVIGMGYDSSDNPGSAPNYYLMHRNGTATVTRVDLGPSAPRAGSNIFDCTIFCEPNASTIRVLILNVTDGTDRPVIVFDEDISTNIPAASAFLFMELNASPGTASSGLPAQTLDVHFIRGTRGR